MVFGSTTINVDGLDLANTPILGSLPFHNLLITGKQHKSLQNRHKYHPHKNAPNDQFEYHRNSTTNNQNQHQQPKLPPSLQQGHNDYETFYHVDNMYNGDLSPLDHNDDDDDEPNEENFSLSNNNRNIKQKQFNPSQSSSPSGGLIETPSFGQHLSGFYQQHHQQHNITFGSFNDTNTPSLAKHSSMSLNATNGANTHNVQQFYPTYPSSTGVETQFNHDITALLPGIYGTTMIQPNFGHPTNNNHNNDNDLDFKKDILLNDSNLDNLSNLFEFGSWNGSNNSFGLNNKTNNSLNIPSLNTFNSYLPQNNDVNQNNRSPTTLLDFNNQATQTALNNTTLAITTNPSGNSTDNKFMADFDINTSDNNTTIASFSPIDQNSSTSAHSLEEKSIPIEQNKNPFYVNFDLSSLDHDYVTYNPNYLLSSSIIDTAVINASDNNGKVVPHPTNDTTNITTYTTTTVDYYTIPAQPLTIESASSSPQSYAEQSYPSAPTSPMIESSKGVSNTNNSTSTTAFNNSTAKKAPRGASKPSAKQYQIAVDQASQVKAVQAVNAGKVDKKEKVSKTGKTSPNKKSIKSGTTSSSPQIETSLYTSTAVSPSNQAAAINAKVNKVGRNVSHSRQTSEFNLGSPAIVPTSAPQQVLLSQADTSMASTQCDNVNNIEMGQEQPVKYQYKYITQDDDEEQLDNDDQNNDEMDVTTNRRRSTRAAVVNQRITKRGNSSEDDSWDEKEKYREKNRISAQKSRQRKRDQQLKEQGDYDTCKSENIQLKNRVAMLESQVAMLQTLLTERQVK